MHSRTRGYLPHRVVSQATYFVTFRLADSLPASVLLECERNTRSKLLTPSKEEFRRRYQEAMEQELDTSYGQCWLNHPQVASVITNTIRYFNSERYELLAWTIMPNHVHVLLTLIADFSLSSILHSWKSFSAKKANQILGKTREFWQREYFDVLVTSERQFEFFLRYVLNNPVKAGLCNEIFQWPGTDCSEEMQAVAKRFFL